MTALARILRTSAFGLILAAGAFGGVLAAPACVDPGGIGGTGAPAREGGLGGTGAPIIERGIGGTGAPMAGRAASGIGGTGAPVAKSPGGIGGTGSPLANGGMGGTGAPMADGGMGGTGIVGTITGFASICVNGVEVHFEDNVPVSRNGIAGAAAELAIGQVVAVEAGASQRGLEARRISVLNAYEGPVTGLPGGLEPMRVMGQPVRFAANAQIDTGLRIGDPVRVSGLRNASGEVVATRVERASVLAQASAIGAIDRNGALQGLPLAANRIAAGNELLVRGKWTGKALAVTQATPNPSIPFAGRVSQAVVEGLVHQRDATELLIGGFTVALDDTTQFDGGNVTDLDQNKRIRIKGTFESPRRIKASRIEIVRIDLDVRRHGGGQSGGGDDDSDKNKREGSRSHSRIETDDDGKVEFRSETRSDDSREKVEREFDAAGEIERERIEIRTESPSGDIERRERIEVRESDGIIERQERIEIFENGRRVERIERTDRVETPDKPERPEKAERPEKVERPDRSGKDD